MSAISIRIQMLERSVIGGEGRLIQCDQRKNAVARKPRKRADQIAHVRSVGRLYSVLYLHPPSMTWSSQDILMGLYVAVAVLLLIVLYHVIFIAVDARKVAKRIERVTREIETVLLKPLGMTDSALDWLQSFFQEKAKKHAEKKGK